MRKEYLKNIKGFTLAEVLITLGIIGVIAAITLPPLVANYKNKILVNQSKNSYSKLSNALLLIKNQNGYDSYADFFRSDATNDELIQELSKTLQMTKICKNYQGGCWNWKTKYNKKKYMNGKTIYYDFRKYSTAVLSDGSVINVQNFNNKGDGNCNWVNSYSKRDSNGNIVKDDQGNNIIINEAETRCGQITIDVNGEKGPNQIGADTWTLMIYKDKTSVNTPTFLYDDNLKYENYQEDVE